MPAKISGRGRKELPKNPCEIKTLTESMHNFFYLHVSNHFYPSIINNIAEFCVPIFFSITCTLQMNVQ